MRTAGRILRGIAALIGRMWRSGRWGKAGVILGALLIVGAVMPRRNPVSSNPSTESMAVLSQPVSLETTDIPLSVTNTVPPTKTPNTPKTAVPTQAAIPGSDSRPSAHIVDQFRVAGLEVDGAAPDLMGTYSKSGITFTGGVEGTLFFIRSVCKSCGIHVFAFEKETDLRVLRSHFAKKTPWVFTKGHILMTVTKDVDEAKVQGYQKLLDTIDSSDLPLLVAEKPITTPTTQPSPTVTVNPSDVPPTVTPTPNHTITLAGNVNMRTGPHVTFGRVRSLSIDESVTVISKKTFEGVLWFELQTIQGEKGWASSEVVSLDESLFRSLPVNTASFTLPPTPTLEPVAEPEPERACDSSYPDFCIPVGSADLDCGDISYRDFTVYQPDRHRFDRDKDGIGCES